MGEVGNQARTEENANPTSAICLLLLLVRGTVKPPLKHAELPLLETGSRCKSIRDKHCYGCEAQQAKADGLTTYKLQSSSVLQRVI